jgi:23S rRNA (guanosine2251-2'-O)-methyltransferase
MENRNRRKVAGEGFVKRHFTTPKPDNKEMVFGIRAVIETIKAGQEIDKLLIQRELRQFTPNGGTNAGGAYT